LRSLTKSAQIIDRTEVSFTVQITVPYNRSMLDFAETLQQQFNAAGVLATQEASPAIRSKPNAHDTSRKVAAPISQKRRKAKRNREKRPSEPGNGLRITEISCRPTEQRNLHPAAD